MFCLVFGFNITDDLLELIKNKKYFIGIKKPSPAQTRRILMGVQQIGRELTEVRFIE